jgi:hypothetical protein
VITALMAWGLAGCASDDLAEPEPTITTRGAFVAVDYGLDAFTLYRILDYADLDVAELLFVSTYDVDPHSYDEARELARDHAIPVRQEFEFVELSSFDPYPHEVVWFRTLTDEEEDRVP